MKSIRTFAVLSVVFAILTIPLHATTCLPGKRFKVLQVCGIVTDEHGVAVPNAKIELVPTNRPHEVTNTSSDQHGQFTIPNVEDGEYDIRIHASHFWGASQSFSVSRSQRGPKCSKPIHAVMVPVRGPVAGCSYVENAWNKSEQKK